MPEPQALVAAAIGSVVPRMPFASSCLLLAAVVNGFVATPAAAAPITAMTSITSITSIAASSIDNADNTDNIANNPSSLYACSSNSTHIGWIHGEEECVFQTIEEARYEATKYLYDNIMPYDVPNALSLGFNTDYISSNIAREVEVDDNGEVYHGVRSTSRSALELQQPFQSEGRPTVDGLADGILNQTLHYGLLAKSLYPWTDVIPRSIYLEYVVPYAIVNEPRTDYRPLLFQTLRESLKDWERSTDSAESTESNAEMEVVSKANDESVKQMKEVVKLINTRLWYLLGQKTPSSSSDTESESKPIVFQAGLTPRIFDPMSVISYGYSSCTGLAILLIAALRSVGIPARLVGTPAWYGDEEKGNHNWVEVFVPSDGTGSAKNGIGGSWVFLEPSPGIAEGDEQSVNADDLDRDPCKRWFCKSSRFNGSTRVFASRYTKVGQSLGSSASGNSGGGEGGKNGYGYSPLPSSVFYELAWAVGEQSVPGEDRTDYYTDVCGRCG